MSVRPVMPRNRPIRYLPERRRKSRNGCTDPRRGPAETLADDVAQTVFAHRIGLYTAFIVTLSLTVQLVGAPWEWVS